MYADYSKDRPGWFFGLSGWQLVVIAAGVLPALWAINTRRWTMVLPLAGVWLLLVVLVVVRIRGRSTIGWLAATIAHLVGSAAGWTRYRAPAATGRGTGVEQPDLPGVLTGIRVHDGPPRGATGGRVALIQNHAARTWSVTAAIVHPGLGMAEVEERDRQAQGLTRLLDVCARTGLIDQLTLTVRTVPDDGAERQLWIRNKRRPDSHPLARRINDDLAAVLTSAAVRTEAFVTLTVAESRLSREARHAGGGTDGRARILYSLISEIDPVLAGDLAISSVTWLTSPELAIAVRTGFAPGDRAGLVDAHAAHATDPAVDDSVPWPQAGPSGAELAVRHYRHDAWSSVSATIRLPDKGAAIGALAPVLTPSEPGERRALTVCFPVLAQTVADRQSANAESAADLASGIRERAGMRTRARQRAETAKAHGMDSKLAQGNCLVRPHAVCCVTVPTTMPVGDYGRRLDASVRRAGFAPLRLDLAQDAGFAAAVLPLGINLAQAGAQ